MYLKSKIRNLTIITCIVIGGSNIPQILQAQDIAAEHASIIVVSKAKFDAFFEQFSSIFRESFTTDSTEPLAITGKKLQQAQKDLKELVAWLHKELALIKNNQGTGSIEYRYVHELVTMAEEYFTKRFVPIVKIFNDNFKKETTLFVGMLKKAINPLVEDASFTKLKQHLDTLQDLCLASGHSELAAEFPVLWDAALTARSIYLAPADPAFLTNFRKRKPAR